MKREEAIKKLMFERDNIDTEGYCGTKENYAKIDAFNMAIEALSEPSGDLISRADAMGAVQDHFNADGFKKYDDGQKMMDRIKALPSAEATKKKAELKENGDWDCPDVYCDECDYHRSVEWCSLAIPNHEEIDETYKMMNEAFFEGFDAAEKRYRFLIETVEELDKKIAEAVSIHEDGTLEVKVPNAQKVGRVLVMDTDSHIGGGLFYQDDDEAEWIFNPTDAIDLMFAKPKCSKCGFESSDGGNFCPNCGARMKGGTT